LNTTHSADHLTLPEVSLENPQEEFFNTIGRSQSVASVSVRPTTARAQSQIAAVQRDRRPFSGHARACRVVHCAISANSISWYWEHRPGEGRLARDHRRLAAIVSLDVAGYSRLMGVDDSGTLAALKAHRRGLIDPKIAEHDGRIVKTTGDGLLLASLCGLAQGWDSGEVRSRTVVFSRATEMGPYKLEND
jgi:hypothetical protein